ncbi:tetrahydromethanopterin S-methyltransferase subunit B [Arcanobacterium wilhelmae]|uniref:Tetrahydromethanopterin S-methyltransferase subunit B n=1 Tax=Arcanobacterium wilhelmae TaxID=1803177 RepID=A0ABT9N952_9ACTO|nr:hypothetical protein [Arcanobacterium wilhelmae]MDP9800222.1 tetrahydromethanopterin S-methyltransferase subunit B [Arcanobacterium wilhelmae]WFN89661.1 hypothetical protein P8A24_05490 [Arcanobacterium wilhelmae]
MTQPAQEPRRSRAKTIAATLLLVTVVGGTGAAYYYSDAGKFARECSAQLSAAETGKDTVTQAVANADAALKKASEQDLGASALPIIADLTNAKNAILRTRLVEPTCNTTEQLSRLTNHNAEVERQVNVIDEQIAKIDDRIRDLETARIVSKAQREMTSMKTGLPVMRGRAQVQLNRVEATPEYLTIETIRTAYDALKKTYEESGKLDTSTSAKTRDDAKALTDRAATIRTSIDQLNQQLGDLEKTVDDVERAQAEQQRAEDERRRLEEEQRRQQAEAEQQARLDAERARQEVERARQEAERARQEAERNQQGGQPSGNNSDRP